MPTNYKHLYEQSNKMLELYQDTIVPELRAKVAELEAQSVEVVRCKDCKWYQEGKLLAPNKFCFRLKHPKEDRKVGYNYAPDDFCSYGERRVDHAET